MDGYFAKPIIILNIVLIVIFSIVFFGACETADVHDTGTTNMTTSALPDTTGKNVENVLSSLQFQWNNSSVVETRYGQIEGGESDNGTWVFLGVPYAKPPVGNGRWMPPVDPEPWDGIKTAKFYCNICPQYGNILNETGEGTFEGDVVGDEDCLYLNIYRPQTQETLPVFVFIHGGANYIGRQDRSYFNGKYFAEKTDMIFVTLNYRIGLLGWFYYPDMKTGDAVADSGNFGTLDTIKGLEWIHDNIASFGGDPENVTVCGQSAGAWNIYALMASPLAKGLYHKVILMSGLPTSESMKNAEKSARCILERLLIQDGLIADRDEADEFIEGKETLWVANYLRSKELSELYHPDVGGPSGIPLDRNYCTGPFVDGMVVSMDPEKMIHFGLYDKVPVMIGCTKDELKLFVPLLIPDPDDLYKVINEFDPNDPEFYLHNFMKPVFWPVLAVYEPLNIVGKMLNQLWGTDRIARLFQKYQQDVYLYK